MLPPTHLARPPDASIPAVANAESRPAHCSCVLTPPAPGAGLQPGSGCGPGPVPGDLAGTLGQTDLGHRETMYEYNTPAPGPCSTCNR